MKTVVDATGARMHYVSSTQEDFNDHLMEIVSFQDESFGSASVAV